MVTKTNANQIAYTPAGGGVPATVENKLREFVSVKDFGAKGDWNGTTGTDDTSAFSAAITYASSIGGATIQVPAGKYRIFAGNIPLASNIRFQGDGMGVSEIVFDKETSEAGGVNQYIFTGLLVNNIAFSNLTLRAETTYNTGIAANSYTGKVHGVLLDKVNDFVFDRVEVRDFNFNGILVRNTQTTGYEAYYSDNLEFFGCRFIHNRSTGLRIESAKNVRVSNCFTENNGLVEDFGTGYGIEVGGLTGSWNGLGVKSVIVENCIFQNENNCGLDAHNAIDVIVANNTFIDCRRVSCTIYNSINPPIDATYGSLAIHGNTFKHTKAQSWAGVVGTGLGAAFISTFTNQETENYLFKTVSISDNIFQDFNVSDTTLSVATSCFGIVARAGESLVFSGNSYTSRFFANAIPARVAYLYGGLETKFTNNSIVVDTPDIPADPAGRWEGLIQLVNINMGSIIANNSIRNKRATNDYFLKIINADGTLSNGAIFSGNFFYNPTTNSSVFHPNGSGRKNFAVFEGNSHGALPLGSAIASITLPEDLGFRSATIASDGSVSKTERSSVLSASNSTASGYSSSVITSVASVNSADASMVLASLRVLANNATPGAYKIVGGYAASGSASTANRKWQIDSITGNVSIAGTLSQSATFTDFAEYFENTERGVIPLGAIVTLDKGKVRRPKLGDEILGVVSATAGIALGESGFTWQGRYLVGEFGEPIYTEVPNEAWEPGEGETDADRPMLRVQAENPDYDPTRTSIPRSERPDEWTLVGLVGQVYVRVSAEVQPGRYVSATGEVSDAATRLLCMSIRQPFDAAKNYAVAKCLIR